MQLGIIIIIFIGTLTHIDQLIPNMIQQQHDSKTKKEREIRGKARGAGRVEGAGVVPA